MFFKTYDFEQILQDNYSVSINSDFYNNNKNNGQRVDTLPPNLQSYAS